MQLKDAPFATLLVCVEKMDDEVRHTYYVRREGIAVNKNFVNTFGIATTQGYPWCFS